MACSSDLPQYRTWQAGADPKFHRGSGEMAHVECNQTIGATIHRRFQDHLVRGVLHLRSPKKPQCYRLDYSSYRVEHLADFLRS